MLIVIFLTNLSKSMVCLPCVKLILCNGMDLGCFGVEHYPPKQVCIENTVLLATLKLCNALKQQIAENHFLIKRGPWGGILCTNLVPP